MSAYLEACLSALQNSDDKRLAGCKFCARVDSEIGFEVGVGVGSVLVYKQFAENIVFQGFLASSEWFLLTGSFVSGLLGADDVARVSAVFEILNSVPRGDGYEW
jgi:hypothetical protein